jgi:cell division protein ZapA
MAQVTISLNGRDYPIACGEGEEARIRELAREIDGRIKGFVGQMGQVGEARLLVLALLTLADEVADTKAKNANGHDSDTLATGIDALAKRIETVAAKLETAKI